jgi:hypothetical protein
MFDGSGFKIEPIIFKESSTSVDGIRLEYNIEDSRIQFHLWPDPEFPENTEGLLGKALLKSYPKGTVIIDYVPEVDSWYVEVNNLSIQPTDALVESVVKKIAYSVKTNA